VISPCSDRDILTEVEGEETICSGRAARVSLKDIRIVDKVSWAKVGGCMGNRLVSVQTGSLERKFETGNDGRMRA
jgi:hypothetical protein